MIKTMQNTGKIKMPTGKKVAVAISCEFNAQSLWLGKDGKLSPFLASSGELDAEVLLPRILEVLKKYGLKVTFFISGHTADTFSDECREIIMQGHEIGHHGYNHTDLVDMDIEQEKKMFEDGFTALGKLGVKPVGFRAPCCEFSQNTQSLLEKYGFLYDNTLMGNDIFPYYPRPVKVHEDRACEFGPISSVLEIPTSLHLDDFPFMGKNGHDWFIPHFDSNPPQELYDRCADTYEYASRFEGSMMNLTIHTQSTGNRYRIGAFERLLTFFLEHDAWIAPCMEIAKAAYFDK